MQPRALLTLLLLCVWYVTGGIAMVIRRTALGLDDGDIQQSEATSIAFGVTGDGGPAQNASTPKVGPHKNLTAKALASARGMRDIVWVFGAYHKTGCELTMQMLEALSGKKLPDPGISRAVLRGLSWVFSPAPFSNYYFDPSIDIIRVLPRYRFVHMVRDPANVVVSAYRYHSRPHSSRFENWLALPMRDATNWEFNFQSVHKEALDAMLVQDAPLASHRALLGRFAAAVTAGHSLQEHYRTVPEADGVLVEAYRSWGEMRLMVDNYNRTMDDPWTLHVRMEAVKADFEKTMRCVFGFLGQSRTFDVEHALKLVDGLDLDRHPKSNVGHVMEGKYDNTALYTLLGSVPHIARARQAMASVFASGGAGARVQAC